MLAQMLKTGQMTPQSNPVESAMDRPVERPASYYTSSNPMDLAEQADTHASVEAEQAKDAARHSAIEDAQAGAKLRGFNDPAEEAGYGRQMEREKMNVPVRAAEASGMNALDRLLLQGSLTGQRNSENIASREKIATNAEEGKTNRAELVPSGMAGNLAKAQSAYSQSSGTMRNLSHMFGSVPKAEADYTSQLEQALSRSGSLETVQRAAQDLANVPGKTLDERIHGFPKADFSQLDPNERAYLQLKLGIQ